MRKVPNIYRHVYFKTNPSVPQKNVSNNCLSPLSLQIKHLFWIHHPWTSFAFEKKLIKILYLQSLPVESVEVFGAPFDLTFVRFLLGVYADVDFQTVRCQEGLATPVLVTDKCVFTYNKSRFCQLVVPIKNFEFILKKLLPVIFLCTV